jgi:hypothetical protein
VIEDKLKENNVINMAGYVEDFLTQDKTKEILSKYYQLS